MTPNEYKERLAEFKAQLDKEFYGNSSSANVGGGGGGVIVSIKSIPDGNLIETLFNLSQFPNYVGVIGINQYLWNTSYYNKNYSWKKDGIVVQYNTTYRSSLIAPGYKATNENGTNFDRTNTSTYDKYAYLCGDILNESDNYTGTNYGIPDAIVEKDTIGPELWKNIGTTTDYISGANKYFRPIFEYNN